MIQCILSGGCNEYKVLIERNAILTEKVAVLEEKCLNLTQRLQEESEVNRQMTGRYMYLGLFYVCPSHIV